MEKLLVLPLLLTLFSVFFQPVSAYRFGVGDGLAIVLFVVIGVIAICALLGWISRKRAGR
uniref:Uncharacterized protein n=1 Tax=Amphimedon queenslandica TaxID=400682 RepID=A0A1X7VAC0_AMPQE